MSMFQSIISSALSKFLLNVSVQCVNAASFQGMVAMIADCVSQHLSCFIEQPAEYQKIFPPSASRPSQAKSLR